VREVKSGVAVVTLTDGRVLTIEVDPDPTGEIQVLEKLPDGKWGRRVKVLGHAKRDSTALQ